MNSDESRKVVGLIFSGKNPEPILSPIWGAPKKIWCGGGIQGSTEEIYEVYGVDEVRSGVTGVGFYFRAFKSVYLTSRVSVFLPEVTLDQLMKGKFRPLKEMAVNQLFNKKWTFELAPRQSPQEISLRAYSDESQMPPISSGFCFWE
jgi:hypothetical protein